MIDTPTGTVEAYEYDEESAHVSHSHTAAVIEEGIPDGMRVRHQSYITFGKIFRVSQCPQRRTVAGDNNRFTFKDSF